MVEDDIAFLLNRGELVELVEPHEIKQNWKVKMAEDDIAFLLNRSELVEPHEIKQNSYCTSANIKIFFLVQYSNDMKKSYIDSINYYFFIYLQLHPYGSKQNTYF